MIERPAPSNCSDHGCSLSNVHKAGNYDCVQCGSSSTVRGTVGHKRCAECWETYHQTHPTTGMRKVVPLTNPADTPGGWYIREEEAEERRLEQLSDWVREPLTIATVALLSLALRHVEFGYRLSVALRLIEIEEPPYPSEEYEMQTARLEGLRDAGVEEPHLQGPSDRALDAVRQVVIPLRPLRLPRQRVDEIEHSVNAREVVEGAIQLLEDGWPYPPK